MKDIKKEEKRSQWETIQDVVTPKQVTLFQGSTRLLIIPKCQKAFLPSKMHFTEVHSVARSVHTAGTYCAITLHLELWPSRCIWHGIVGQNGQKSTHILRTPSGYCRTSWYFGIYIKSFFFFFCGKLHNSVVWVMEVRTNTTEIPYLCTKGRAESCHVPMLGHRDCYESPVLTEILKTNQHVVSWPAD